jgi:hypothetical protein
MKNIFLLIFILIFLYIICNRCIEKFSVGGENSEKTPINISGSLTLSYIDKCKPPKLCTDSYCNNNGSASGNIVDGCSCTCSASYTGDKCNLCKIKPNTKYTYWVPPKTCTCPKNTILSTSSGNTRCGPPPPPPPCSNKCDDLKDKGKLDCDNSDKYCNCVGFRGSYNCRWKDKNVL